MNRKIVGFVFCSLLIISVLPATGFITYDGPYLEITWPPDNYETDQSTITLTGYAGGEFPINEYGYTILYPGGGMFSEFWPINPPVEYYEFEISVTLVEGEDGNLITVYAKDTQNNKGFDSVVVVYIPGEDITPPVSTLIVGEPNYENYVTSDTLFSISAEDNSDGSGVAATYYRIKYKNEWTDWMEYTIGFNLPNEGPYTIEYYSIDYAENSEDIQSVGYISDNQPPGTTVSKAPEYDWYIPNKWALICNGGDNDGDWFPASALQGYYTLKNHGYDDEHIILLLCHNTENVVHVDNANINILSGPDGIAGNQDDPQIDHNLPESGKTMRNSLRDAITVELKRLVGPNDEVLIYLIGHGTFNDGPLRRAYFTFEDGSEVCERTFASWVDEIECHKIVIVGDFCYSGCFLDTVESDPRNTNSGIKKPVRILISSAGRNDTDPDTKCGCCSMYGKYNMDSTAQSGDFAGGYFSYAFWKAIDRGRSYGSALTYAKNFIPIHENLEVEDLQHPEMEDINGNSDINSPTEWENTVTDIGHIVFSIEDEGGISYGDLDQDGEPVGGQDTYYRIWYNDNWEPWTVYDNPIPFTNEGLHKIEWYSIDLLGNTEELTQHVIFVDNTPPNAPELLLPSYGSSDYLTPTFDWEDSDDDSNAKYQLQVSTNAAFTNIVLEKTDILLSEYPVQMSEEFDSQEYFWRVKATDGLGFQSDWSEVWTFDAQIKNNPPDKPDKPTGPTEGAPEKDYLYSSKSIDDDNDRLHYVFDWGDGTEDILYWYDSGETVSNEHYWKEEAYYTIKVKSIDEHGEESSWSDPLTVRMPKNRSTNTLSFLQRFFQRFPFMIKILNQIT